MSIYRKNKTIQDLYSRDKFISELYSIGIKNFETRILNSPSEFYHEYKIKKKSGKFRYISAPNDSLKEIQNVIKMILENSLESLNINFNNSVQAFQKSKSIFTNAQIHRNQRFVLHLDIKDFFDSIHFGRVSSLFKRMGASQNMAYFLANICCYNKKLPQGAPTSPLLANLIARRLDRDLLKISHKFHFRYTRYADDLVFSSSDSSMINKDILSNLLDKISLTISKNGFDVNWEKLSISGPDVRHTVTGLSNNKKVSVTKEFYKNTRAMADSLYITNNFVVKGKKNYVSKNRDDLLKNMEVIQGRYSFILDIESKNRNLYQYYSTGEEYHSVTPLHFMDNFSNGELIPFKNRKFSGKEVSFGKFLFFKYFLSGDYISIFTEGMTDLVYLESALKVFKSNLNIDFMSTQNSQNKNDIFYKMFDIGRGGEELFKIVELYYGYKHKISKKIHGRTDIRYNQYFRKKLLPLKPCILLLDYELIDDNPPRKNKNKGDKPLTTFINNYIDLMYVIEEKVLIEKYENENNVNYLKLDQGKKKSIKKQINYCYTETLKKNIKKSLETRGFYRLVNNLYIVVTTDLKPFSVNRDIESYFPEYFRNDVKGDGNYYFGPENTKKGTQGAKPMGKFEFSEYVYEKAIDRDDKDKIFAEFKILIDIISNVQSNYIEYILNNLNNFKHKDDMLLKIKKSDILQNIIKFSPDLNKKYSTLFNSK